MSLRVISLKEREEGKGYALVEWFGSGDIAWGGGRWLPGRARSAIVDREGAEAPASEVIASIITGLCGSDTGESAPAWATYAVVHAWEWVPSFGGWKRTSSRRLVRLSAPNEWGDEWEERKGL